MKFGKFDLLWQVLDHVELGHGIYVGDSGVELLLQLLDDVRVAQAVVQQGARRVARGVAASDELGQGFGRELRAAQLLALLVLALHQARQQVDAVDLVGIVEALLDTGDGDAGQVLDGLDALGEEGIREVLGPRLDPGHAADRTTLSVSPGIIMRDIFGINHLRRNFSSPVQYLNGRSRPGRRIRSLAYLRKILALLQHAEGSTERQIADYVEGKVIEPVQGIHLCVTARRLLGHTVPLLHQHLQIGVHVLLELADRLGAEGVGNRLALAGVLGAVARVEEAALDRDECIVVFTRGRY